MKEEIMSNRCEDSCCRPGLSNSRSVGNIVARHIVGSGSPRLESYCFNLDCKREIDMYNVPPPHLWSKS